MAKATQFCIALENKPGSLARLCGVMRKAGADLVGISLSENADSGWVRLVAAPEVKARRALTHAGYTFITRRVLVLRPLNKPGELERIAKRLSKAGVNIEYVYGTSGPASSAQLILGVSNLGKAEAALPERGRAAGARRGSR